MSLPEPAGVSVCMVAYNALDKLRACLDSLHSQQTRRAVEVILVDNASAEPVGDTVAADYPWVHLVRSATNLGFAGGTNLAVERGTQPLRLLLNPDTVLPDPDLLERYCGRIEATPDLGALGLRLAWPDGSTQMLVGHRPRAAEVLLDLFHLHRTPSAALEDAPLLDTEYISGAALLTSAEVWQRVGPLDEGYFMYFEDVDWCRRAEALGLRLAVAADLTLVHHEGATYGGRTFQRREHFWRAFVRYLRKFDGPAAVGAIRVGLTLQALLKLPLAWLLDRSADRDARLRLLRTQLRLGLWGS